MVRQKLNCKIHFSHRLKVIAEFISDVGIRKLHHVVLTSDGKYGYKSYNDDSSKTEIRITTASPLNYLPLPNPDITENR